MSRDKAEARREGRQARAQLSPARRAQAEREIHGHLQGLLQTRSVEILGVYAAAGSEVGLSAFIHDCLNAGVVVAWPRVAGPGQLSFHALDSVDDLISGWKGILEPPADTAPLTTDDLDLLLVPGICFDSLGGRLGQGGGFYDRLLLSHPAVHAVGIAFQLQMRSVVPVEAHDARVDGLVTEEGYRPASPGAGRSP